MRFDMKFRWLTQGSFLFESNNKRLLVDPYMSDFLETKGVKRMVKFPLSIEELKPDALLCTHDHLDHLDPETVVKISGKYPDCVLAGPERVFNHFTQLEISEKRRVLLQIDQTKTLAGFDVLPVFAKHSDPSAVGIIISADNKKVYLSGDTEFDEKITSNQLLKKMDLVLICINGKLGNMTLEQAFETVKKLRPVSALPMHYGLFSENTADPLPFIKKCIAEEIKSFEMKYDKFYNI
ncbi:MAG: hypothetical protein A2017_09595 [Lentisphaerae bacterium GWF2_44_16]|nr:MAG: hypothetical protein A2017_09595 [Lentisphaerae bacterium GWF2_44_16]